MHRITRDREVLVIATSVSSFLPQTLPPLSPLAPERLILQIHSAHAGRAPIVHSTSVKPLFPASDILRGWFQRAYLASPFTGTQFSGLFTTFCIYCVGLPLPPTFSLSKLSHLCLSKLLLLFPGRPPARTSHHWPPPETQQLTLLVLYKVAPDSYVVLSDSLMLTHVSLGPPGDPHG